MTAVDSETQVSRFTSPLFGDNRMKLGMFATNVSNGCAPSTAEGGLKTDWKTTRDLNVEADRLGFEALVPVCRWKGLGGQTDWNGTSFDTYTWAAGIAALTNHAAVFSTSHVTYTHPLIAAKMATTIDHISGGRFALNVVGGGVQPELAMFNAPVREHDALYEVAEEWIGLLRRLWTEDEPFDFEGKFHTMQGAISKPKPIQRPFPPIMNAGLSPRGQRFAAENADMMFFILHAHEMDKAKQQIDTLKTLARRDFGRELQAWSHAYVVCRETEQEARKYLEYYVDQKADWEAVDNLLYTVAPQTAKMPPEVLQSLRYHFAAGWGGYPLVGTAEQIVDHLTRMTEIGVDGLLIHWQDFGAGLDQWREEIMPMVEQAGLRKPHVTTT